MNSRFRLLIFDLDGTLIDSTGDLTTATNLTLGEYGLPPHTRAEVCRFVGDGAKMLLARAFGENTSFDLDEALVRFITHYRAHLVEQTAPYDGIPSVLAKIDGIPKAIASNKPEHLIRPILDALGWSGRFEPILGGDSLPERKPHPSMIESICKTVGVAPADALMIGDSVQDVAAGLAAGTSTCGVSWGFRPGRLLTEAGVHWLADSPQQLFDIINQ